MFLPVIREFPPSLRQRYRDTFNIGNDYGISEGNAENVRAWLAKNINEQPAKIKNRLCGLAEHASPKDLPIWLYISFGNVNKNTVFLTGHPNVKYSLRPIFKHNVSCVSRR